jgi:aspartyl-tRNA(Asn)/glutamyl-tRNA(Gln) amidotransferase subunit A
MKNLKPDAVGSMEAQPADPDIEHNLPYASIGQLGQAIRKGIVSPVQVVETCLARIDQLNPQLNAFITVLRDEALEQARIAEAEVRAGRWHGALHGIPVGIKDMFDTAGIRTTAAFEHFKDRVPTRDALAVTKLKNAGAIVIGKMNMHRLAMGTTSAESDFGAVHNPWNSDRIAGGSSGGSAAAIAAGLCYATLDTDAIGSCRLPAACCGVTGFKGSYGLIDNSGILEGEPADESILWLSHAAVTARSAEDAGFVLNVLAEPGAGLNPPLDAQTLAEGVTLRVGVVTNFSAHEDIRAAFNTALASLRDFNTLTEITAPLETPGFDISHIETDRQTIAGRLFGELDLLVLPTTADTTPRIDAVATNPAALSAQNTLFANYYGLPAIGVPCGFDRHGMPISLQIVGSPAGDWAVLRLAQQYQHRTTWVSKHPFA